VQRALIDFNHLDPDAIPQHRRRIALLLYTPALQAHSVIRYAQWRQVIAEYVAERYVQSANELLPRMVGQVSLALALSAYEHWLEFEDENLGDLLNETMRELRRYLLADS
jgi:TetR/AcrR family transcriptional regulator, regulator of mycofactocin system